MALIGVNSIRRQFPGIVATCGARRRGKTYMADLWKKHYLWTLLLHIAGASPAAVIAKLNSAIRVLCALVITIPDQSAIVLFHVPEPTSRNMRHRWHRPNKAERHVAELTHYIRRNRNESVNQFSQIEKLSALSGELAVGRGPRFQ